MKVLLRVFVVLLALALPFLLVEGGYSLWTGGSLVWDRFLVPPDLGTELHAAERRALGEATVGPYQADPDPAVGLRMKAGMSRKQGWNEVHTDAFGQRKRVGPEAREDATRIVVLGDSVAFGFGRADEETIGAVLEEALAGAMEQGRPRPHVQTVACPGWSGRNATRYFLNHLGRLDPDVVVLIPVLNDLDDGFAVNEVGHREYDYDPFRGAGTPHVSTEGFHALAAAFGPFVGKADRTLLSLNSNFLVKAALPVHASGVTPESQRRWAAMFQGYQRIDERLREKGGHLALVLFWERWFDRYVELMAREFLPEASLVPGFDAYRPSDGWVHPNGRPDAHPNSEHARARALEIAAHLVGHDLVPGARADALPEMSPEYAERRVPFRSPETLREEVEGLRAHLRRFLRSEIVAPHVDTMGEAWGHHQVYGGLHVDVWNAPEKGAAAWAEPHLHVALARAEGAELVLDLEAPEARHRLGRLVLEARVSRTDLGPRELAADGAAHRVSWPLPEATGEAALLDVTISCDRARAAHGRTSDGRKGAERLQSYRLRRIAIE